MEEVAWAAHRIHTRIDQGVGAFELFLKWIMEHTAICQHGFIESTCGQCNKKESWRGERDGQEVSS